MNKRMKASLKELSMFDPKLFDGDEETPVGFHNRI